MRVPFILLHPRHRLFSHFHEYERVTLLTFLPRKLLALFVYLEGPRSPLLLLTCQLPIRRQRFLRILQHARQELPRLLATTIRHYGSVSFLTVSRHEPLVHLYQLVLEGGLQAGGKHRIIVFLVFTAQIFQVVFLFLLAVVPERVGTRLCNILHKPCAEEARSSL